MIKEDELPEGSGWLAPRGDSGLTIVRHAARKKDPRLDDIFLASLMRSVMKGSARMNREQEKHILESSYEFKKAKMWQEASTRLIQERTGRSSLAFDDSVDSAYKGLVSASLDADAKKVKKQVTAVLDRFQSHMLDLYEVFALVAHVGLLTKDEAMKYVIEAYGGEDESCLKGLRKQLKDTAPRQAYKKNHTKRLITLLELLEESSHSLLAEDN